LAAVSRAARCHAGIERATFCCFSEGMREIYQRRLAADWTG